MNTLTFNLDKFKEFVAPNTPQEKEQIESLKKDKSWLILSGEIAIRVHKVLREKKMSQNDLAQRLGLTKSSVSKMLSGNTNFTLETLWRLEKALDVTLITVCSDSSTISNSLNKAMCDSHESKLMPA
ncbi:MAG: helix-turn-helix transcriptional regulator [Bacteroidales bacterium]|nr:helix-turn-helix transcriptional regulator [Bacteroidales bacterium]